MQIVKPIDKEWCNDIIKIVNKFLFGQFMDKRRNWWGLTAQLKTVIDKCYCKGAYLKNKKDEIAGNPAAMAEMKALGESIS